MVQRDINYILLYHFVEIWSLLSTQTTLEISCSFLLPTKLLYSKAGSDKFFDVRTHRIIPS